MPSPQPHRVTGKLRAALLAAALVLARDAGVKAGDILRGGFTAAPAQRTAFGGGAGADVTQARANAADALARTTQALQAVQAMQAAARKVALGGPNNLGADPNHLGKQLPNVPNGLAPGGLQVAPGAGSALWQGANLPAQSSDGGRTTVTIRQTAQQAFLTWKTFNVGRNTTLDFDQSAGGAQASEWIAFNKINDPSGVPSQILGSIQAQGQVYVINQNGIIFGGGSQVNVHTLVASSLPINDNLVNRGLLNNPDLQFLFSSLPIPQLAGGVMAAFTPPAALTPDGEEGDVVVQPGAILSSPTTPAHVGGRIALVGPNVTNEGSISTPDGQTILAAGLQVGFAAHPSADPSLRGLDAFIGAVSDPSSSKLPAGAATNDALIQAPRADVTMAGKTVNQLGVIDSTTSVTLNGRIDLTANYDTLRIQEPGGNYIQTPSANGVVTLGPGSVSEILPELSSASTVVGTHLALPSQVNVQGGAVHLAANAGILAPNASVTMAAGTLEPGIDGYVLTYSSGQIYLDAGAAINVAGSTDVLAPVSENIVSLQLRGAELADSPLQRSGLLRSQTINVDLRKTGIYNGQPWVGTPLADASGYVGLIQRSAGELTTAGGSVKLTAGGSVVMQPGSAINVSGGWIDYQGGTVQTTRVISGGQIFDISNATPDMVYSGIYTGMFAVSHPKWGVTADFMSALAPSGSHYEPGYMQGASGGTIAVTAPAMALDGGFIGNTFAGPRQRQLLQDVFNSQQLQDLNPAVTAALSRPGFSTLSFAFEGQNDVAPTFTEFSASPPKVLFQPDGGLAPAAPFGLDGAGNALPLSAGRREEAALSPALLGADGFGVLNVDNSDGGVMIPRNTILAAPAGGSIAIKGANIDVEGRLSAPGGSVSLTAYDFSPNSIASLDDELTPRTPPADPARGIFTLGPAASLDVAGLVVNDRPGAPGANTLPMVTNGGSVAIRSYTANLAAGSAIDASGGVAISAAGKLAYGNAGSIDIEAGQNPSLASDPTLKSIVGGKLALHASLRAYAGPNARAGSLTILAPLIQVGGAPANPGVLSLSPDFFSQGGFGGFAIEGLGQAGATPDSYLPAIVIAPNTAIAPVAQSWLAAGDDNNPVLSPALLPAGIRTPVSLAFQATGVTDPFKPSPSNLIARGDFIMGKGASIRTDPLGSVSISGNTAAVLGTIIVPGGNISIGGKADSTAVFPNNQGEALPTVDLGPGALLSTAGVTLLTPDPRGFRTGSVLPGGNIAISGNIVAEAGSMLDVSGAAGTLEMRPAYGGTPLAGSFKGYPVAPTPVDSNAGSITLAGGQELFTDAVLAGHAGGPGASGGSLTVSSGIFTPPGVNVTLTPLDAGMVVTQNSPAIPASFYAPGGTAIGNPVVDAAKKPLAGLGYFAADSFAGGGFDALTIKGSVRFSGPVALAANRSLTVADGGVVYGDAPIKLVAPYVAIGTPFRTPLQPLQQISPFLVGNHPFDFAPSYGPGSLTVDAGLIDIGFLSLQDIGKAAFVADDGEIRGNGTLDVAGAVSLRAGQIYPPTEVSFTIAAYDYESGGKTHPGSVSIAASGERRLPLSAGGQLNVYGSIINQGGVLRAPLGSINLGWDNVGTAPTDMITGQAVNPARQLTLAPGSVTSVSAVDPATGKAMLVPYGINLNGVSWIDPAGTDITAGGPPGKAISISAANVAFQPGATVDLRGGGDLYAYRFVDGIGGTVDTLASSASFAVIPGYQADFAPYAPYNPSPLTPGLGSDPGYVNGNLSVGDKVYLGAGAGLPAGAYTLLPARYALLPGAFLVTPQPRTVIPNGTVSRPDGSSLVSGYRFNAGDAGRPLNAAFEVDPQAVVRSRAEYADSFATAYLGQAAAANKAATPRLPVDAGHLVFEATQSMSIEGAVAAQAPDGGLGGLVDISFPGDFLIAAPGAAAKPGAVVLNSSELSSFGAASLLIGGLRQSGAGAAEITVAARNITVDNAGAPLTAPDIILAANDALTVDPDAQILSGGAASPAQQLLFGAASTPGSGDGVLLRVSNDSSAQIIRSGVDSSTAASMVIDAGARLSGKSVILDSTYATKLDPNAILQGEAITLDSGQISIRLANPGSLKPTAGLVLSGLALQSLESSASVLSLLSYSSIDIYGAGTIGSAGFASLALHAPEIRGFSQPNGNVTIAARHILLDNASGRPAVGPAGAAGALQFDAGSISFGADQLDIDQYAAVVLKAADGFFAESSGGLAVQGSLALTGPLVTGATGAKEDFSAGGALTIQPGSGKPGALAAGGLGGSLTFEGASVTASSDILLPGGTVVLHATAGDVTVGGRIDAGGVAERFFDLIKYTGGGQITLISDAGSVNVTAGGVLRVAADAGGGDAGGLSVSAPAGVLAVDGVLLGQGGAGGQNGSFSLDVGSQPSLAGLEATLDKAAFTASQSIRVRTGDVTVDGVAAAHSFNLSADEGSIDVVGKIDASGVHGGAIDLEAGGNVVLSPGALLTAAGLEFNSAGEGGSVSLETTGGAVTIAAKSTIDLSVAANTAASASIGDFTGTLHLRAPQNPGSTDLAVDALAGNILNASSIVAEGGFAQDAATAGAASIDGFEAGALANATAFMANDASIRTRLLAPNAGLANALHVQPGEEIDNSLGDLVLNNDWDLSTWRFGPVKAVVDQSGNPLFNRMNKQIYAGIEPGDLTLRAMGSIFFNGSLTDGFGDSGGDIPRTSSNQPAPYQETLLPRFADGSGQMSWSYAITAGADFSAADRRAAAPLSSLGAGGGSVELGRNGGINIANPFGPDGVTSSALAGLYQVIRTGAGSIDISAGRDVQLLNQFATIYTAGVQVANPAMSGAFDLPSLNPTGGQGNLGAIQEKPAYPAQYSLGGGDVTIVAQGNIEHLTQDGNGNLVPDSERELPMNWLYRRGYVDPATGQFGAARFGDVASTTWWIDFSNFFEGVGALGGGDVTLIAGRDISNVDALVPTNARMPKTQSPSAGGLVELGGGDLLVRAGGNIDGGVYYVERGQGVLDAGDSIVTNSTRSPSLTDITGDSPDAVQTWLPTTLFLGKGSFDVNAGGSVLLGPVANPFLLPEGYSNSFWYKSYFSTYAATDAVNVSSLTGAITFRESAVLPASSAPTALLQAWIENELLLTSNGDTAAYYQPWLRLDETDDTAFTTVATVMPPALRATAFSGGVNIAGNITLSPSPVGTFEIAAAGSLNGLQPSGRDTVTNDVVWGSAVINVSDADPNRIPGVASPFAYQALVGNSASLASESQTDFLTSIDVLFAESGATLASQDTLDVKQALHAPGVLHAGDSDPVHVYARGGDISGFTLFSPKAARVVAGGDVKDIGFYIQNDNSADVSVVAAGGDIVAYDSNSPLRAASQAAGNEVFGDPMSGDIQISGPGTLEVLAGRNLDLGVGPNNGDGTAVGVSSIGDARNPYLPFAGAAVIAGAGIGPSSSLADSDLDFPKFVAAFLGSSGGGEAARYLPDLAVLMGMGGASQGETLQAFKKLAPEKRDALVLDIFYLVLRDAGRDHNVPGSAGFNNFNGGYAAIKALFPNDAGPGDISLTSREIKTESGGDISLFAPGGRLTVGFDLAGSQPVDQGVFTEDGGNISIFTRNDVTVGTSRIFTLRGGNEIIWSSFGNIAAGASSKTVKSAPPTRVLIDPQSADVKTDLAGLATGGGIGVLETVTGVPAGDVDLVAPVGTVDAGDAGIRVSGNLNIAALHILNAGNIVVGGASAGVPATTAAAPNIAGLTAASNTAGAATSAAETATKQGNQTTEPQELPSIITVEVLGYGGGEEPPSAPLP